MVDGLSEFSHAPESLRPTYLLQLRVIDLEGLEGIASDVENMLSADVSQSGDVLGNGDEILDAGDQHGIGFLH